MPVSKDISLNVLASVDHFAREMGKIPGITEKQAAAAAKALSGQLAKAEVQNLKNLQDAAKRGASGLDDLKKAAGAVSPTLGGLARDAEDLIAAFGPVGVGAGLAAAAGALLLGFAKLTTAAAENSKELEKVGLISHAAGEQIRDSANTVELATEAWKGMGAVLDEVVSFALQGLIRWTLIAAMAWDDFVHMRGVESLETYVSRVMTLEEAVRGLHDEVKSAIPGFDAMRAAQQAVIDADGAWAAANTEGTARLQEQLRAMAESHAFALESARERIDLMAAEGASEEALAAARTQLHALEIQQLTQEAIATKALEEAKRAEREKTISLVTQSFDTLLSAGQTAAQGQVEIQAVLQAVQIALAGAAAGWQILAQGGLFSWPAALITWGAAGVSAGWALGQGLSAPSKHPVPHLDGAGREERREERRANRARNRDDGAASVVVVQYRHRHFDDATDDAMRRNSPLSRLMHRNGNRSR